LLNPKKAMEKERIKEGLRALYPKVGEDLIEAAATYPTDSMVGKFIARIIARAASYGHAKETIGDLCPIGHELSRMLGASIGDIKPPPKGDTWAAIKAKTFEEWKRENKAAIKSHGFNDNMTSFDISEILKWRPKGELKLRDDLGFGKHRSIEKMFVDEAGPYFDDFVAGWNHESFEQEKIAHLMMGMDDPRLSGMSREIWLVVRRGDKLEVHPGVWNDRAFTFDECNVNLENASIVGWIEKNLYRKPDVPKWGVDFGVEQTTESEKIAKLMHSMNDPRLHGNERDIWIVRGKPNKTEPFEFEVWSGRYSGCNGPHYTEGPHRHGDWVGWMEKEDYQRPKGEGDGR
jgi:hypothetical protein